MLDVLLALSLAAAEPWQCSGTLVPPAGYEQDVAFSKVGAGEAADAARQTLTARVCQGTPCPDLAARVAVWLTGEGGGQHCAMAVLERHLLDEWRQAQTSRALHVELRQRLGEVLRPEAATAPKKAGRLKVAIGRVGGEPQVEQWLRGQLLQGLSGIDGVDVVGAAGKDVGTVDVGVVERSEAQRAIVDLSVTVTRTDGTVKAFGASVPRAVVPVSVEESADLSLQVLATCERKGDKGFSAVADCAQTPLFAGDRLRLKVTPSTAAHVYVLAYNSKGQFQMLFPAPDEPNLLSAPMQLPADDWLVLDDVGNVTEHLVVVAAVKRQSHLELLRGVDLPARVGSTDADALVATRGFLGEVRARGFNAPPRAKAASTAGPATGVPVIERGPGVAAVELTIAHR